MGTSVNKLLREHLESERLNLIRLLTEDFGYRAGDLNTKAEPKSKFESGNRSTGHFGTGFYFFGDIESAKQYAIHTNREVSEINLDGYNLAKGDLSLHTLLKNVNKYGVGYEKDDDSLRYAVLSVFKHFNKLHPSKARTISVRSNKDFEALTPQEIEIYNREDDEANAIYDLNNKLVDGVVDAIHNSNIDSPSTVVMKSMGFDGVDVRGSDLDNAIYGSVIYDLT